MRAREGQADEPDNTNGDQRPGQLVRLARWLVGEFTAPEPWEHRPASLAQLWRYATRGEWTGPHGPARVAGTLWCRLVTMPVTVLTHYTAWIAARPSRTIAAVGLWGVLMQIRPVRAVAEFVLPWTPWPSWGWHSLSPGVQTAAITAAVVVPAAALVAGVVALRGKRRNR